MSLRSSLVSAGALLGSGAVPATGCAFFYPIGEKVDSDGGEKVAMSDSGGPEISMDGGAWGCSSDQACSADHQGEPFTCRLTDHSCQPLLATECPIVYPRTWGDPHAVLLGAYALLPPHDPENSDLVWNYELAVREFNDHGGIPDTNGVPHTLATIICNSDPALASSDPQFLARSLDHLTDTVGVPAIVADLSPKDLVFAFERTKSHARDVFFISPGPANDELARLDDDGRVWSMIGVPTDLAPAYKALLKRVEAYVRAIDPLAAALRVALVKSSDVNEPRHDQLGELLDALTRTSPGTPNPNRLEFNDRDLAANQMEGNYKEFVVDAAPEAPALVGRQVLEFAPHVVLSMMGPAFTHFDTVAAYDGVADTIESLSPDRSYPFFILSPVNASAWGDVATTIKSIAQRFPDVHRRFIGIDVATADDPTLYYQYLDRLRSPTGHTAAREGTENYYDPIYYMAYAMYRAGVDAPFGGKNVLAGMNATLAGARYDIGPDPMPAVFAALAPHQPAVSIELVGTMGEPNFNQLTGIRVNRAALYCFPPPPSFGVHLQVQVYVADRWNGTFDCYPGF